MNLNVISKGLLLSILMIDLLFVNHPPASADCSIEKTPTGYSIVCSGSISEKITGTIEADMIRMLQGASLEYYLTESAGSLTEAVITGIYALQGNDDIINEGNYIKLGTTAETTAVGVSLTIDGIVEGGLSEGALSDAGASAEAAVTGIDGSLDNDMIDN